MVVSVAAAAQVILVIGVVTEGFVAVDINVGIEIILVIVRVRMVRRVWRPDTDSQRESP